MSSTAALGSALFPPARLARSARRSGSSSIARPATILPRSSRRRATGSRVVAEAKDAKAKDAKTKEKTVASSVDESAEKRDAEKRAPPAPPAAPAGFEAELSRLSKAGVRVHKLGTRYLDDGKIGEDVKELQRFLTGTGHYQYKDGPTGYYGPLTTQAVKRWQAKYGLPDSGGWGAQSRATYLNVKRAELRAMRDPDPETAAERNSAAMRAGLIDKKTGLPVPPSVGGGRAGAPGPSGRVRAAKRRRRGRRRRREERPSEPIVRADGAGVGIRRGGDAFGDIDNVQTGGWSSRTRRGIARRRRRRDDGDGGGRGDGSRAIARRRRRRSR